MISFIVTALVFLLVLSVLVLIHEWGHFFAARKFGIKVEEFGFGIPPRAWGKKIGETIYSINWLPIGGFVKLYGEDEAGSGSVKVPKGKLPTKELDRAFFSKPVWQRAIVVVAGVVMNALLAFFIYYVFLGVSNFKAEVPLLNDHKFFGVNQVNKIDPTVTLVSPNSPAEQSGMREFSKIQKINGSDVKDVDSFQKIISEQKGKEVTIQLFDLKKKETYTVSVTPRVNPPKDQGALGIGFGIPVAELSYETPTQKLFSGIVHPVNLMVYNFDILGDLIGFSVRERDARPLGEAVSGPVGIASLVGDILGLPAAEAAKQLLNLAGILSISLAFFNILPIPALDGGRLFFILFEGVTGKKVSPRIEGYAHTIGMAVLLTLILLITFKDIFQLFTR